MFRESFAAFQFHQIYIYITVVFVVCSQLIGRTRFPALHSEIDWKLIQTKKPCEGVERRRDFRLCFCRVPNPPPTYTDETAHAVTFFFCRVPNRRQQTCSSLYPVKRPCLFQRTRVCALRRSLYFSCGSLASTKKTSKKRRCAPTDVIPGVRGYLGEEWTSEWTASKQPTPKHSRPPLIRGGMRQSFCWLRDGGWTLLLNAPFASIWLPTTLKSWSGQWQEG